MSFASSRFLLFLSVLFILYYVLPRRFQWKLLLAGSIFFYWCAGWKLLFYIGTTVLTTYGAGRKIGALYAAQDAYLAQHKAELDRDARKSYKAQEKKRRLRWMLGCLLLNLGILAVVKYADFMIGGVNGGLAAFRLPARIPFLHLALPMGISFYTFQAMGYLIDVYWGKYPPEKNLGKFALFVTFFPQLIQGPISRYNDLSRTLYDEHRWDGQQIAFGAQRILWGLAKKLIVADRLAIPLRALTANPEQYNGVYVLSVMFLYAVQLYADFTGGIDITIGAAQLFGIKVEENFIRPFFSKNTAEYWRRWHISMGTWFRDYVFYPLSVSTGILRLHQRCRARFGERGKHISMYLCTLLLWFITGLWHGASWNFIVWGVLNGVVIIVSQACEPLYERFHTRFPNLGGTFGYRLFQVIRTFWLMSAIRVLDVYRDVPLTFRQVGSIFTAFRPSVLWDGSFLTLGIGPADWIVAAAGACAMLVCSLLGRKEPVRVQLSRKSPHLAWGGSVALILLILVFGVYGVGYDATQFIYNQF